MPEHLTIATSDIVHRIKLSCQIPSVIEAIASQAIILETANQAGIEVTEEELQAECDKVRLEKKLATAKDTWAWLDKHHLSVMNFEELVHNSLISKKLANHLFSARIDKFFYENRIDYDAAVTYEVTFKDRDLAFELFYALEEGEITFPEIARLYIQDIELRRNYGYQGVKYRKDFRPEIASAIFATSPPGVLKPISTVKGVYLIWVEEIIQPELDGELREKIISDSFESWLRKEVRFVDIAVQINPSTVEPQDETVNHY